MVVIVVSGRPGCGNSTVAKLLAKRLKLKHFSVGDYNKNHAASGSETDRSIAMWDPKIATKKFHNDSDALARKKARQGNIVIDAKLGIKLIKSDFSVWLKAPKTVRAKRLAKRDKTSLKEAMKNLNKKETLERSNFKRIYNFDYFSQEKEADFVINTGNKKPKKIVDIIMRGLE
jgi:cytidylate kinase